MTRVGAALLAAALLVSCSSLQANDAGVSNLQVLAPLCNGVELGTTLTLAARTFDQKGDTVDAPVLWRTADPAVIDVNSNTGEVTGLALSDTARVQAVVGTKDPIISDFISLVVTPKADTLTLLGSARIPVSATGNGSPPLGVTLLDRTTPAAVKAFPLVFRIIEPIFPTPEDRTVEFPGGSLTLTLCSAPTGAAATTLNRRANHTAPDSAIVEVTAQHPDGSAVPGSGQRFTIVFTAP